MMSLIDLDDEQRWVPTHVNVTVLRARGLRIKGKHGSRYLYAVIQVGRDKYTTGLVERAEEPEWNDGCSFELLPGILEEERARGAAHQHQHQHQHHPPGSADLVVTVMHRVLIGLDVFLGQATVPLERVFQDGVCPREEWLKLNSKVGRKEKDRGELQVTVQFTRNNMTASMFDLTMKDKPRSAFGKLKDRVTGRKRSDMESSSAIVPGRYAALSGSLAQPLGEGGVEGVECGQTGMAEEKKSKVKDFFRGKLRKSSETRSSTSLASENIISFVASDNPAPPPSLDLLADPPSSPIYTSKVRLDTHYGETDLAKKVLTSQHTTKIFTHKRAFSDEASKITPAFPQAYPVVESMKGQSMSQSKSSLCINGSHVYDSEPSTPKGSTALPSKLVLLEKCSPLSRSLQNLTKRSEDKSSPGEGRRWSFDKLKKEERAEEREAEPMVPLIQSTRIGCRPVQAAPPILSAADSSDKGKKLRKTLFSGGRSDSLPNKSDQGQAGEAPEGRLRGWFGSSESQNKPRLEVSRKVESSSDLPPPFPPGSPVSHQFSSPSSPPTGHVSPENGNHNCTFTPSPPSSSNPISPSNPFLQRMQRNPFFEELIAEELRRSPPLASRSPSGSASPQHAASPSPGCAPSLSHDAKPKEKASIRRERPRPVARQISLPALLSRPAAPSSPDHPSPRCMSENGGEWEDSFDALASSRLNSPKRAPQKVLKAISTNQIRAAPIDDHSISAHEEPKTREVAPPPLPPRRFGRTPVNEMFSDSWLHRGQKLVVHKEACLLSQTGAASLQHGREAERKRTAKCVSPDYHTGSETSDSLSVPSQSHENATSPVFMSEEKLRKFKYEPIEDESDRWRGMLFEQDLYGRVGIGNCREPKVNGQPLPETLGGRPDAKISQQSDWAALEMFLDKKMSVADLLSMSTKTAQKSDTEAPAINLTASQQTVDASTALSEQPPCVNNNIESTLTFEDLNMNVNNSDFTFIDSDGSSPSELVDTVKGLKGLDKLFPQPSKDLPDDILSVSQNNCLFVSGTSPNKPLKFRLDMAEHGGCEFNNVTLQHHWNENGSPPLESPTSTQPGAEAKLRRDATKAGGFEKGRMELDDNRNLQSNRPTPNSKDTSSGVVSARIRPKGTTTCHEGECPNSHKANGHNAFERLSSVDNISEAEAEVFICSWTLDQENNLSNKNIAYRIDFTELDSDSDTLANENANTVQSDPSVEQTEGTGFRDLHASVAPAFRTPPKSKIGESLREPPPSASILSLTSDAEANTQPDASLHPCLSILPPRGLPSSGAGSTLAVAPYSSSLSFSPPSSSCTAQPPVDAQHTLLPEEKHPAISLPRQESSPHPVKPLSSAASQSEKKEGRSVLEKLKSSIHPGRSAPLNAAEPERSQEVTAERSAQYQNLTNMELISLLLQQEMDQQKQQAACDQQAALLEKREAELKKVKAQVRDLEDYIDNLLLRIMEQTPTLLQVRSRHK